MSQNDDLSVQVFALEQLPGACDHLQMLNIFNKLRECYFWNPRCSAMAGVLVLVLCP